MSANARERHCFVSRRRGMYHPAHSNRTIAVIRCQMKDSRHKKRSLACRAISLATMLAAFGALAGKAMARQDAWAQWFGLDLGQTPSIALGAIVGAALGVSAAAYGGGGRGTYWESTVDEDGGDQ